jgi:hypothetical protein
VRHRVQPLIRDMPPVEHFASFSSSSVQLFSVVLHLGGCPDRQQRAAAATVGVSPVQQERHVRQRVRVQGGHTVLHPDLPDAAGKLRPRGDLQGTGEVLQ